MAKEKKSSAAKKPSAAKTRESGFIAKAPIRRLMKVEGADLVAESAVDVLIQNLVTYAQDVTKKAVKAAEAAKKKRLTADDIKAASL